MNVPEIAVLLKRVWERGKECVRDLSECLRSSEIRAGIIREELG